jgi:RimJ/RimL family protein N-acetyltransferase
MFVTQARAAVEGARIELRDVVVADHDALFAFQCDPAGAAMAMVKPRSREAFDAMWARFGEQVARGEPGLVAKAILADGVLCGSIGCFVSGGEPSADELSERELSVGYGIGRAWWGRGIASRALALLLEQSATRPIFARAAASNVASRRVLEKNGFVAVSSQWSPETERYLACEEVKFVLR